MGGLQEMHCKEEKFGRSAHMKKRITGITGKLTLGVIIFGILLGAIISVIG